MPNCQRAPPGTLPRERGSGHRMLANRLARFQVPQTGVVTERGCPIGRRRADHTLLTRDSASLRDTPPSRRAALARGTSARLAVPLGVVARAAGPASRWPIFSFSSVATRQAAACERPIARMWVQGGGTSRKGAKPRKRKGRPEPSRICSIPGLPEKYPTRRAGLAGLLHCGGKGRSCPNEKASYRQAEPSETLNEHCVGSGRGAASEHCE